MKIAEVKVSKTTCETTLLVPIPKGIVGATISIEYMDSAWDSLQKTVVFRSSVTKDVLASGNEVVIPAEVVSRAGKKLYIGVYGVDAANNVVIPTIWAELGMIHSAADPSGDSSSYPLLPVWAQIQAMIGNLDDLDTTAKNNLVAAINEAMTKGVSWNELKDKPFYLEKTLFIELTKDDFVPNNESRPFYTSSPKLDWMASIDNVSIELNLVYNDGTSYVITENSFGIYFETIREDDGREYVNFGDDENFDIFSGPEDSFSITIWTSYENLTEIHLALYRKDIKKIPGIFVDAAIGKTALNVAGYKTDETTGDDVFVEVPAIEIPVSAMDISETDVFYDTERNMLKIPAKIMPWNGTCQIVLNYKLSNVVGSDMPFSLKEGDAEWEYLDHSGNYYTELLFHFIPSNSNLSFMVKRGGLKTVTALAASELGYAYYLMYTYGTDYKTISGHIRRIL